MQFGIKELWSLRHTVMEIARENGIPHEEAVTRFLSDVELQYNNKLGFQCKIDSLRVRSTDYVWNYYSYLRSDPS